ncbi:MAG: hypothetical protein ACI9U2_004844, partial [Bradymonadia bacterium]
AFATRCANAAFAANAARCAFTADAAFAARSAFTAGPAFTTRATHDAGVEAGIVVASVAIITGKAERKEEHQTV